VALTDEGVAEAEMVRRDIPTELDIGSVLRFSSWIRNWHYLEILRSEIRGGFMAREIR